MDNIPILLLGYNRDDLLEKRVNEISKLEINKIYISIDGGKESYKPEMTNLISKIPNLFSSTTQVKITHYQDNLGLTKHITHSISKILEENENIIVVEDDVSLNTNFYKNMAHGINLLKEMGCDGLVSAFSPMNYSGNHLIRNKWRKSIYFSCWGWGCSRSTWEKYDSDLSKTDLNTALENSQSWNNLSLWQKNVWKARFERVQKNQSYTWDLQMQFASFLNEFTNLAPLYRFVDNEGFNDERATHTREPKPRWMSKKPKNHQKITSIAGSVITKFYNQLDELLIAGDSELLPVYESVKKYFRPKKI
jgi:hypothetical protein